MPFPLKSRRAARPGKRPRRSTATRLRLETLERRFLLAAAPIINEVVADNDGSRLDANGNASDWLEIYNAGDSPVDLENWYLTDDADQLTKWSFPAATLNPHEYRIVFASGCQSPGVACPDPGAELHANFRIGSQGSYVALIEPDGSSIASELRLPEQLAGMSFGNALAPYGEPLIESGATAKFFVPQDDSLGRTWTGAESDEPFDDSAAAKWTAGNSGFGFELSSSGPRPIAYWDFDDSDDFTTALDSSGNNNHGLIRGATYTADAGGHAGVAGDRALDFGAVLSSAHVDIPSAAIGAFDSLVANDSFTVSLWVFGNAGQPGNDSVFYAGSNADGSGTRSINVHLPWGDGTIYFDTGVPSNCCSSASRVSIPEPDPSMWRGQWNHYVFVKNGDSKQIWQNGDLLLQGANTNDLQPIRSFVLGIGANKSNWGYGGLIDDVAVWDQALDPAQIASIFSGSSPLRIGRLGSLVETNVASAMHEINASAFLRFPFDVASPEEIDHLTLRMHYDDGFVAYLNGTEILRQNAPSNAAFDAVATQDRDAPHVLAASQYDISADIDLLRPDSNILAIHGLNSTAGDGEFLIAPELLAGTSISDRYLVEPTPGAPNACWLAVEASTICKTSPEGFVGLVGDIKFDADRGYHQSPFDVRITNSTPGASIIYTTDGSTPSPDNPSATIVDAPPNSTPATTLHIGGTTTPRATAVKPGFLPADVDSQTYFFIDDIIEQPEIDAEVVSQTLPGHGFDDALLSIPTLSITTAPEDLFGPSTGIMTHPTSKGRAWERAASVEFIDPNSSDEFQIDVGLQIHGGISRNDSFSWKRSFKLFFREEYGQGKLDFPLFSDSAVTRFDQLVLKASSTDSWAAVEWGPTPEGFPRWQRHQASYIRDQWIRDTQQALGQGATHGRFVHVFLNGEYWGQYGLTERPIDSFQAQHFGGEEEQYDVVHDCPQECGLQAGSFESWDAMMALAAQGLASDANYQRIQGNNPDGAPNPDIPTYIDIDNFIDYMIPHIAFGADDYPAHNWWAARRHGIERGQPRSDGFRFFIWDQEISNNSLEKMRNSSGVTPYEAVATANSPAFLYDRLRRNAEFRRRFADRVHEVFFNDGPFTPENNRARWKARSSEIDHAIVAESARWGDSRRAQPYRREIEWLAHEQWIDNYWDANHPIAIQRFRNVALYPPIDAPMFNQHGGPIARGFELTISSPAGTIFYTTDGSDPRAPDGSPSPTAQAYLEPILLGSNSVVQARNFDAINWSALTSARFIVNAATADNTSISEIQYHPPDAHAEFGDLPLDADEFEFVEIWNFSEEPVNLAGVQFRSSAGEGIQFTFDPQILAAGERLVVRKNAAAFSARYGPTISIAEGSDGEGGVDGQYGGKLANGGERVSLFDAFGAPIASFAYGDSPSWPQRADGFGSSLELSDPLGDLSDPNNWRSSLDYGGSPGAAGTTSRPIVINEVLTHTDLPDVDWIELYNATDGAIDVGRWYLSDDHDDYFKFAVAPSTSVGAGQYIVFSETDFNSASNDDGFSLDSTTGDDVWLLSADSTGRPLAFIDHVQFAAAANGESFGRWPNGDGGLYPMADLTPGNDNSGPRIGPVVISEIMYNPAGLTSAGELDDLEFVEIENPTAQAVDLTDWRLEGAVRFAFPHGLLLDPRAAMVVLAFDPTDIRHQTRLDEFLSVYGLDASVNMMGPFTGKLDNAGETLRLLRPGESPPEDPATLPMLLEDEIEYDDNSPWPESADGAGFSLTRRNSAVWGNDPQSWVAAVATPGNQAATFTVVAVDVNTGLVDPPDLMGAQPTSWQRQRSDLRSITITFNQSVSVAQASNLVLVNLGVDAPATADEAVFLHDAQLTTLDNRLRISFQPDELPEGVYRLDVLDSVQDVFGARLDGDRDGQPGGSFDIAGDRENGFYKLAGDFNGDSGVSIFDFSTISYWFGHVVADDGAPSYIDLNRDGGVSIFDFSRFAANFGIGVVFPLAFADAEPRPLVAIRQDIDRGRMADDVRAARLPTREILRPPARAATIMSGMQVRRKNHSAERPPRNPVDLELESIIAVIASDAWRTEGTHVETIQ